MSKINPESVTHCMRCQADLERGYSTRYTEKGGQWECKEVICFGCDRKENLSDHMKTGVITTHFMMDCTVSNYDLVKEAQIYGSYDLDENKLIEIINRDHSEEVKTKLRVKLATTRIQKKIKEFDQRVWFKGLQDQILKTQCRGVSAKLGKKHNNFCVLTWTCAGRTMITIEDDDAMVTAVADETSKESRTGLHGIRATGEQALGLLEKAMSLYEDGTLKFKDDKKVSML